MYSIPPNEKSAETKICTHCGASFDITDKDLEFYDKISPVFAGVKYSIPSPTLCPNCRQQRRLSFRNERKLYKRKCDLTGKDIISIYSPDKPYKVYEQSEWWSDKWDPMEYGRDFDFTRPFFEQFEELSRDVPVISMINYNSENSEYCNYSLNLKDCYFAHGISDSQDSYYVNIGNSLKNTVDCMVVSMIENSYELIGCAMVYNSFFCLKCENSSNLQYCNDCIGCDSCLFCSQLTNKKYCILNTQYSQEEYVSKKEEMLNDFDYYYKQYKELYLNTPQKNMYSINAENCTGDFLYYCKNSKYCFDSKGLEDCKNITNSGGGKNTYDVYGLIMGLESGSEYILESVSILGYRSAFCLNCDNVKYLIYCTHCYSSDNLFACTGLRNKSYCILNKQYTREEYEELVPKIIEHMRKMGEWGEFFPSSLSPFGYNETDAQEYHPLSIDVAVQRLYNWSDYEVPFSKVEKIIPASKLPDDITKIPDDILNWAIECEVTKTRGGNPLFRIIKQELEFYRKHNLPIPRRHPDQRHLDRMSLRNPRKLFERKCDKCGVEMMTTYSPDRPEIVYCESCYNKEIL